MVDQILASPVALPPGPWKCVGDASVGGLLFVGFAPDSDLLLATSSQGRGVFDATNGKRIARDRNEDFSEDTIKMEAVGIGPLDGQTIRMAGIYGGGLPITTADGWQAERLAIQWPLETLLLVSPGSWVYGASFGKNAEMTKVFVDSEIRAWGFSPTGRSLILALSNGLRIYSRQ